MCVIVLFLCHCCFVGGGGGGGGEGESKDQSKGANLGLVTKSETVVHNVASLGLAEASTGVLKKKKKIKQLPCQLQSESCCKIFI